MRLYRERVSNYLQSIYDLRVQGSLLLYVIATPQHKEIWGLERVRKVNHFPLLQ